MDQKTKAQSPAGEPGAPGKLAQKDYGKVKPRRIVPGVMGRAAWFARRAGRKPNALSVERLRAALETVQTMKDTASDIDPVIDQAHDLLAKAGLAWKDLASPVVIDRNGGVLKTETTQVRKKTSMSRVGRPIQVPELRATPAILIIPVDRQTAAHLDLDELVGAEQSDPRNSRLVESFRYLPEHGAIAGRIDRGGVYGVFAYPKHPWLRQTLELLHQNWKWIAMDGTIRKAAKAAGKPSAGIVDRICQLILCAPEYGQVSDPRLFARAGVGLPPGFQDGKGSGATNGLPPALGKAVNLCERCVSDFLGELDVIDDLVIAPPLVKWHWLRRPRCSRWVSVGPFPGAGFGGIGRVTQLDIHPSNGNILIAGAAGGGVWRTDNGGMTWRPLMETHPTLTIGAVAIAPSNPQVMYAASGEDGGGWNPAWDGAGIYHSNDGGRHWALMSRISSSRFSALVVDPTDPDTVYAAGNAGFHKSRNGGTTWITNGGSASLFDGQITDAVIAHDDPQRLYIGVANVGVFVSTSGGERIGATPAFSRLDGPGQLPAGSDAGWIKLAIGRNGADGSHFLAAKMGFSGSRIFRTTDAGSTWTELAPDVAPIAYDEWCSVIAVSPANQNVLYAGAASELRRTTNGGASAADWAAINAGIHADQQDICFDPNDSTRIFLANDGGVYRSNDQGGNWEMVSGRLAITQFYDIDIAERDKDIIAGGAQDNGVYYRDQAGVWRHIPWGDGTQVAIDPTDPAIFYFSSQNGLPAWLRRSTDGGATHDPLGQAGLSGGSPWITIIKLDPTDPITDPANNRIVFVCGYNVLFRSTNGGQQWQRVNDASGNALITAGEITALEFAPSDPGILYLGTSTGAVYRAVNGGAAAADWSRIDTVGSSADMLFPDCQIQAIRVNAANADDIWVVFGGAGVTYTSRPGMILNPLGISHLFRSTNGGQNWTDASGRFSALSLPDVPTSAVAISDVDSEIAYAGTDVGVFRTADGGVSWTAFQDGLPRSPVVELRYHRRHDRLVAATMGRGVFVRDV